jgi:hypothetical protein
MEMDALVNIFQQPRLVEKPLQLSLEPVSTRLTQDWYKFHLKSTGEKQSAISLAIKLIIIIHVSRTTNPPAIILKASSW